MSKKPELVALAYCVVIFTSLFVHVPLKVKINPLEAAVAKLGAPINLETSSINEVLFVKLLLTYLLFTKTNMNCNEFIGYVFSLEATLLLIVRKASFFLHTSTTILFFNLLCKYYPEQRNSKTLLAF
jgi:hypothetical protein